MSTSTGSSTEATSDQGGAPPVDRDEGPGRPSSRPVARTWLWRGLGVALALVVWLLMAGADVSPGARAVAAVATLMATWWVTEAAPLSVTSLLPIALLPLLAGQDVDDATAPYASSVVFLFLGGFLIAIAMQKWNLHRRIALITLRRVGTHPRRIILGMMIATGFLSMWVSNTATTLMMLPIAISVLALVVQNSAGPRESRSADDVSAGMAAGAKVTDVVDDADITVFGVALMLSVAWSASIGGLGTLLGSPPNAIVAGYLSDQLGKDVGFVQWMLLGVPIVVVFIGIAWVLITRVLYRFDLPEVPGGKAMIDEEIAKLGPVSQGEKTVAFVFVGAAFFWVVPGLLSSIASIGDAAPWLGSIDDTVIAIAAGALLFILPGDRRGSMVLDWDDAEKGLPWGVLLLFGGGLSLAAAVAETGLDEWFGTQVSGLGALPIILLLAAVVTIVIFLTELTSNTATAATFIPVLGGVAIGIGVDPTTLLIPAALAATCAFMLPVGTPPNAIVFGTGAVTIADMARGGLVLNVVGIILITLFTVLIGPFALGLVI